MKAIRIQQFGAPDVITLQELPVPKPDDGEILVQVAAAGVGPWDAWVRAGKSVIDQPLPLTPGSDLSGHVAAVGRRVSEFHVGQCVYGVTNPRFTGAYAEYALASAARMAAKPRSISHVEAASVPVVATTAHQMLFDHARLVAGQRVLIHGAGGSVGAFAVQLALNAGARVIGTDLPAGAEYARRLGAAQVIDIHSARFEEVIEPVDTVIDTVGGDLIERSFGVLKPGGVLVSSVSQPNADQARRYSLTARFILVDVTTRTLTQIAQLIDQGSLKTHVGPRAAAVRSPPSPRNAGRLTAARSRQDRADRQRPRAAKRLTLGPGLRPFFRARWPKTEPAAPTLARQSGPAPGPSPIVDGCRARKASAARPRPRLMSGPRVAQRFAVHRVSPCKAHDSTSGLR